MTVPPDAKLERGVHTRLYNGTAFITDGKIEEINRLDDRHRERYEKKKDGGDECGEDGK
jgi:hypothetical protein